MEHQGIVDGNSAVVEQECHNPNTVSQVVQRVAIVDLTSQDKTFSRFDDLFSQRGALSLKVVPQIPFPEAIENAWLLVSRVVR
jgi:hypothetical protein